MTQRGAPQAKNKSKTQDKVKFEFGRLYKGRVSRVHGRTESVSVVLEGGLGEIHDCEVALGFTSYLLGIKTNFMPTKGTRVALISGSPSVVIATLKSDTDDPLGSSANQVTGTAKQRVGQTKTFGTVGTISRRGRGMPADLLEGELQLGNALGVAISLLTTMAKVSAGDRAQVSTHLLNGMVRIISEKFKHFSAFGDLEIFNNGRLNAVWNGSSYDYEVLGRLDPKDKATAKDNIVDMSSIDALKETGRWRFSQFVGFLGDFVNLMVTDPVQTLATIGSEALRSGKARVHIGTGGEFLVQSVSEIALERVVRIPVPVQMRREEDPKAMRRKDFNNLNKEYLKLWKYETDPKNLCHMAFQIREYARWLSNYYSMVRFHQMEAAGGDWKVPTEAATPAPSWASKETDREAANTGAPILYKDTYACMRIMRDGGILTMNGEGGTMGLIGNNGYMCVPGNFLCEAGGDMRFLAGQSMYFQARNSMEFAAIAGGIRMKARAWFHGICEWGSVWFKSDAPDPKDPAYQPKTQKDCTWGAEDPLPIVLEHAVLLEGTKGRACVAGTGAKLSATRTAGPTDDTDLGGDAIVESTAGVARVAGQHRVDVRSPAGQVRIFAAKEFLLGALSCFMKIMTGELDINHQVALKGGAWIVQNLKALRMSATNAIYGPKTGYQVDPPGGPPALKMHYNHIQKLPKDPTELAQYKPTFSDDNADLEQLVKTDGRAKLTPLFVDEHPLWNFDLPSVYQWPNEPFFESLAQQRIRTDGDLTPLYVNWTINQTKLQSGPHNGSNIPFVGTGAKFLCHDASASKALNKPSTDNAQALRQQTALKPQNISYYFKKKNT